MNSTVRVFDANLDISIDKCNLEATHSAKYCQHALYCIAVNDRNVALTFRLRITVFVNDSIHNTNEYEYVTIVSAVLVSSVSYW